MKAIPWECPQASETTSTTGSAVEPIGGGVARLPEDGKNRAGDETEDGQGHGDFEEGKSPRSRFRLAAREGHFSS